MCGIAGILTLSSHRVPSSLELEAMASQLRHRGPDGDGFYMTNAIGLAHTRLSIIDVAGGAQPIHNEDKTVWVVFNGEIYNYVELRRELIAQGHRFYTQSDTEVIVHLYEQHGEDFVHHLNGQFAIGLWDERNQKLILVRDRVGIAPLYYSHIDGRFAFASEIKSLLPLFSSAPGLNITALDQIMTFWAPVSPNTLFNGIEELSPGKILIVEGQRERLHTYWDWNYPPAGDFAAGTENQLTEQLLDLLIDATKIRLRADVPVGAYLSGGLDSSVITSLIHHCTDTPLRTFSIGFDSDEHDESAFQRIMIDHLGAEHSRFQCSQRDVARYFPDTIRHTESTVLRTAPTPMKMLSRLVHEKNYKVVLTGEGADEVLGGYDIFKEAKVRQFWARNPNSTCRPALLQRLYPYLDISSNRSLHYLQSFFGAGLDAPSDAVFAHMPRWDTTSKAKNFFSEDLKSHLINSDPLGRLIASLPEDIESWDCFNKWQYIEAKSLMGGYLLCSQGDRMLMSNSVEGRFPFLDHRVIEFANRLPPSLKMKVLNEKYLLKRAVKDYLPEKIIARHKQPYRSPDASAFYDPATAFANESYVDELLSEEIIKSYGYFDPRKVSMLVKKARNGKIAGTKDNQAYIGVLSTQIWHHIFVENFQKEFSFKK